ncbi:AMP-binding protein [Nioella nitratireducens]|uniref:AMP-binding protein n=1 Tax=Nioella nitratireducens TaxID=1287720 RepID=UPI0008FD4C77|nr:AMP-binding protein [Nioella nitratireducens]
MQHLFDALSRHAALRPDAPALNSAQGLLTWWGLESCVADLSARLSDAPAIVGIACSTNRDAAVADLAITHAGRCAVHLPPFFSPEQIAHIVAAAGIGAVVGDVDVAPALPLVPVLSTIMPGPLPPCRDGASRVIFTSGSSGRPKGVVIGARQLAASLNALADVIAPSQTDRHFSILPMAQLLEQICGLFLPILAGAEVIFAEDAAKTLFGGPVAPLLAEVAAADPTTTILVPGLLARWVAALDQSGTRPPANLRFVAVGGAPTAPALLQRAEALGLPVYEGYGLSECCAVVAMNRPGAARQGTVGPVLPMLDVTIDAGEIVVSGPTVMQGYLGHPPAGGTWRTGDLGHFNDDGALVVDGRKDWLIVTPEGRNISPEWVETRLTADPRIPAAGLLLDPIHGLTVIAACAASVDVASIAAALADLPPYARPRRVLRLPASAPGLLKFGGGIDRSRLLPLSAAEAGDILTYREEVPA